MIYAHRITHSCITRGRFERGIYEKRDPGRGKFIDRGLSRALNGVGARMGAAAGGEKTNTSPGGIDQGGAGDWGEGLLVSGPSCRVTNTTCIFLS